VPFPIDTLDQEKKKVLMVDVNQRHSLENYQSTDPLISQKQPQRAPFLPAEELEFPQPEFMDEEEKKGAPSSSSFYNCFSSNNLPEEEKDVVLDF